MKSRTLPPILFAFAIIGLWTLLPRMLSIPRYVFPPFDEVCLELWRVRGPALRHLGYTSFEAILGLLIGVVAGFALGTTMALSKWMERVLLPYVVGSNAVPVVAIAPIVVLWVGHGIAAKALVAAFLCFFPTAINSYDGIRTHDREYSDLFQVYHASRMSFFIKYRMFHALPFIFSGLRLSATFAVIGAIVAEFVGSDRGLGFAMLQGSYNLHTSRLYAYLLLACGLGMMFYFGMCCLEALVFRVLGGRW